MQYNTIQYDLPTEKLNNTNERTNEPGNGYIEGRELDHFLREFVASVSAYDLSADVSSRPESGRQNSATLLLSIH